MIADVRRWITACIPCEKRKKGKNIGVGEHKSVLQSRPFEIVSIDLVGPFPKTPEGYCFVLTMIDHFTRYPIAVPIKGKTMEIVASALKTHLFLAFPFWPRKILSDKGSEFVNKIIHEVYRQLKVKQVLTSHDNPQANQVERFHRYMNAAISTFIEKKHNHGTWDHYLDAAVFVYRCTTNHATGHSPFYALYGRHPIRPLDYLLSSQEEEQKYSDNTEYAKTIVEAFREAYEEMHKNQVQQSIRNMKYNNKEPIQYNVGDFVYSWRRYKPGKLDWTYHGPFQIVEKITEQTYKLMIGKYTSGVQKGNSRYKQVTVRHLRPYNPFDDEVKDTSPSLIQDEEDYSEEDIEDENNDQLQEGSIILQEEQKYEEKEVQVELTEGMMVIIPYWGWADIEQKTTKFCAAKVLGFQIVNTKEGQRTLTIIHRYGNDVNNYYHAQKPAYITKHKETGKTKYRHTMQPREGEIPYTNYIKINNHEVAFDYEYYIEPENIIHRGFKLTDQGKLPEHILQKISKDQWLTTT